MSQNKILNTPYGYLSKYRTELMGIAILLIVWYHTSISFDGIGNQFLHNLLNFLKELGFGCVDIFLLVSGFGVWHSLQKNTIPAFYLNRLKKILPIWWIFIVINVVTNALFFHYRVKAAELLGVFFFTGFWRKMDNQGNWYVYAIMLFYLISPVIYSLLHRSRRKTWMTLLLVLAAGGFSAFYFYDSLLIALSRLPVFILGFYLATDPHRIQMTIGKWLACIGICIAGILGIYVTYKCCEHYLWDCGLWWYPFILIAPTASVMICRLFHILDPGSVHIGKVFRIMGKASLEILLTSDLVYTYLSGLNWTGISPNLFHLLLMILSVLVGLGLHFLIELIKKQCFRRG